MSSLDAGGSAHYKELYKQSIAWPEEFWATQGRALVEWKSPFVDAVEASPSEGVLQFYSGGKLNVSENCVDRHVHAGQGDKVALLWEKDELGETQAITYRQLMYEVSRLANVLKRQGVRRGDVVTIYMPMCPHAVYAMLACARLGAPHSVVFAGFSAEALAQRIDDAGSKVVITADQGLRGGKRIPLKLTVDAAIASCPPGLVKTVLVYERSGAIGEKGVAPMQEGRDLHMQAWGSPPSTSALTGTGAHAFRICTDPGLTPLPSAPGLGSPLAHLHRDWAHPFHICTGIEPARCAA
jgi:acetyl-CoA synthetase